MKTCKKISTGEIFEYRQSIWYPLLDKNGDIIKYLKYSQWLYHGHGNDNQTIWYELKLINQKSWDCGHLAICCAKENFYNEYIDIKKERKLKLEKINDKM